MTNPSTAELLASLHGRSQKAKGAAASIEDPTVRRALEELAEAVAEIARHLKTLER